MARLETHLSTHIQAPQTGPQVLNYAIPEAHNGFSFSSAPGGSIILQPLAAPEPPTPSPTKKKKGSVDLEEGSVARSIASKQVRPIDPSYLSPYLSPYHSVLDAQVSLLDNPLYNPYLIPYVISI